MIMIIEKKILINQIIINNLYFNYKERHIIIPIKFLYIQKKLIRKNNKKVIRCLK